MEAEKPRSVILETVARQVLVTGMVVAVGKGSLEVGVKMVWVGVGWRKIRVRWESLWM